MQILYLYVIFLIIHLSTRSILTTFVLGAALQLFLTLVQILQKAHSKGFFYYLGEMHFQRRELQSFIFGEEILTITGTFLVK